MLHTNLRSASRRVQITLHDSAAFSFIFRIALRLVRWLQFPVDKLNPPKVLSVATMLSMADVFLLMGNVDINSLISEHGLVHSNQLLNVQGVQKSEMDHRNINCEDASGHTFSFLMFQFLSFLPTPASTTWSTICSYSLRRSCFSSMRST